jgi:hypothetical protein
MYYTTEEINSIHASSSAVYQQIYTTYEGDKYIGTSEGRLKIYYPVQEPTTTTTTTAEVIEEEEVVEEVNSYFEPSLDNTFQLVLQPIDPIETILFNNVFVLDTTEGVLMPSDNINDIDEYWEFENASCIIPKDNITL